MRTAVIAPNQSLLDMALMACGTIEASMKIMAENETSITGAATTGSEFMIPDDAPTDSFTLLYLGQNKIVIGTNG